MKTTTMADVLKSVLNEAFAKFHTAMVAKVTAVNVSTIDVKPVVNKWVNGESTEYPELTEVIPLVLGGGSSYLAMPITVGDYCLLIISENCFDNWYSGNDYEVPPEQRKHDLSDAIAIVGLYNSSGAITIPSVITQHGDVESDGDYTHTGNLDITGDLTVTGTLHVDGNITCTGDISADGTITGVTDVVGGGISLKTHTHNFVGVAVGAPSVTAGPN